MITGCTGRPLIHVLPLPARSWRRGWLRVYMPLWVCFKARGQQEHLGFNSDPAYRSECEAVWVRGVWGSLPRALPVGLVGSSLVSTWAVDYIYWEELSVRVRRPSDSTVQMSSHVRRLCPSVELNPDTPGWLGIIRTWALIRAKWGWGRVVWGWGRVVWGWGWEDMVV